jgi:hypothetical protein
MVAVVTAHARHHYHHHHYHQHSQHYAIPIIADQDAAEEAQAATQAAA